MTFTILLGMFIWLASVFLILGFLSIPTQTRDILGSKELYDCDKQYNIVIAKNEKLKKEVAELWNQFNNRKIGCIERIKKDAEEKERVHSLLFNLSTDI